MKPMITRDVQEDIEIIDVANKINHNTYVKTLRVFGILIYSYRYKMKTKINEDKQNSQIGFSNKEK